MALFEERFESWTAADFDAYAEAKWKSNRFNLERTRVKARAVSLLEQALVRSGVPAVGVELWTSRHEPVLINAHVVSRQLVLLTRPMAAREAIEARDPGLSASEPDKFHAYVGVEIQHQGLAFRLALSEGARADRQAWTEQAQAWLALAVDHTVQIGHEPADVQALAALAAAGEAADLRLELTFTREAAIEGAAGIDDLAFWLTRTLPLLQALLDAGLPERDADAATPAATQNPTPAATQNPTPAATLNATPAATLNPFPAASSTSAPAPEHQPIAPEPPARRAGSYRPAVAPSRRAVMAEQERAPIDRIVPPTWKPEETHVGRELREAEARAHRPPPFRPAPPRQDGPRREGPRPDAPRYDGPRQDAPRQDGPRQDGPRQAGPRRDGPRQDAPRRDAHRPDMSRGGRPYELGPEAKKPMVAAVLGPGARVRLTSGLFAGKLGTVAEIRGEDVQVMLGLMAVKVGKSDLQLA